MAAFELSSTRFASDVLSGESENSDQIETEIDSFEQATFIKGACLPENIRTFIDESRLDWYQDAVVLPLDQVDPVFVSIAEMMPERSLVLGGGSDLVQLVLGLPKAVQCNILEVNTLSTPGYESRADGFYFIQDFDVPGYSEREAVQADLFINSESWIDLNVMATNSMQGKHLVSGYNFLMVPLKHSAIAQVEADGTATLFFRTRQDYLNYCDKILTLPDIESISFESWRAQMDDEKWKRVSFLVARYAATVYARAKPLGWSFDAKSLQFLREMIEEMGPMLRAEVLISCCTELDNPESANNRKEEVFLELGLL